MAKTLTKENVYSKPRYRTIIKLIINCSNPDLDTKIKFSHLKYALVKKSKNNNPSLEERMKDFFSDPYYNKIIQETTKEYEQGKINKKTYFNRMKILKNNILQVMIDQGIFSEDDKFTSDQALRDALGRLKKLGFIDNKPDTHGYDYYIAKKECLDSYLRWFLHYTIDELIPDKYNQALGILQVKVYELGLKIKIQKGEFR